MRYLLFVSFLVVVVLFAHLSHRGSQERLREQLNLAVSSALALDATGTVPRDSKFKDIRFEVSDLDIILSGSVSSVEARDELVKLIRDGTSVGRLRFQQVMMNNAREPELVAVMVPGTAGNSTLTLEGRVPTKDLADRLRRGIQGPFVNAQNLLVDDGINAEQWLDHSDAVLAHFFQGAKAGEFELKDGALRLKRNVESPAQIDSIKEEVAQWLPSGRYKVSMDGIQVAEAPRPVELSIRKTDGRWMLNGSLPDQPALESISRVIEEADPPAKVDGAGVTVDESLIRPKWLLDGRIERFLKVFVRAVRENPEVFIRAGEVRLLGTVSGFVAKPSLTLFAGEAFGYDVNLQTEGIQASSPEPASGEQRLRFDLNPGSVIITGAVPSDPAKRELMAYLAQAFPGTEVKDNGLVVDAKLPPMPWLTPLGAFFQDLAALTSQKATIDVSGQKVYLGGMAKTKWSCNALVAKLEQAMGPDFSIYDLLLVDPRGETSSPKEVIKVFFAMGSHELEKDQVAKIAEAAERIGRTQNPNLVVLIKGYASPGGSAKTNVDLSDARAKAVYTALLGRGVNAKILKPLGVGVDTNLTGEEARRVEIFIR